MDWILPSTTQAILFWDFDTQNARPVMQRESSVKPCCTSGLVTMGCALDGVGTFARGGMLAGISLTAGRVEVEKFTMELSSQVLASTTLPSFSSATLATA